MNIMEILLKELEQEDEVCYKNFLRMSAADFRYLLDKIKFVIEKQNTHMRNSIPAAERLAITLRFLATGDSYHSLMYLFRIPVCTISRIIPEVCSAIYNVLKKNIYKFQALSKSGYKLHDSLKKMEFPTVHRCTGRQTRRH
ncbi:uncharacterized protein LOC115878794 [Sitophilus oryzae]|uniref:Uncharacterized protein LOC115878794 n=1 Tax=Sitophilus oryzae TaxID=7048 RepID=A0A6J2XKT2_SITOR|nr:uncharacterized protein LOC115878794 [Sitophilus oryzae]